MKITKTTDTNERTDTKTNQENIPISVENERRPASIIAE